MSLTTFLTSGILLILALALLILRRRFPLLRRSARLVLLLFAVQLLRDAAAAGLIDLSIHLLKAANALFIFLLVALAIYLFKDISQAWLIQRGITVSKLFWDLLMGVAYAILILVLLKEIFNIDVTPLLATSAVITVVIGLAVQDTLINLIAGTVFHFEDTLRRGDWIQLDDLVGQVRELTWRTVQLVTPDQEAVIVPNQDLTRKQFVNLTREGAARVMEIGVSYADDPDLVMGVLRQAVLSTTGVLWNPPPVIYIQSFADFSIVYRVRFFIKDYTHFRRLEGEVRRSIWYFFRRHGITIPFPIRTLQLERRKAEPPAPPDGHVAEAVAQVEMFRQLDPAELAAVAKTAEIMEYPAGAVIAAEGEVGRSMFVIRRGSVEILKGTRKVAQLGVGDICGEIALFTGDPRGASVVAAAPLEVLVVHKAGFDAILKQNKEFVAKIERMVTARLQSTADKMAAPRKSDADNTIIRRIRKYLLGE